jgi:dienelactone hydrolase
MARWFRGPLLAGAAAVAALVGAVAAPARAAVKTQDVKYAVGGTEYVGFLAYDDATADKRPGVLVAPEWTGLNDYAKGRAKQLAEMGYVAFVFDPYGGGKTTASIKEAAAWSTAVKADRPGLRARIGGAFDTLKKQPQTDPAKTAAIGYCFGGTSVLELARGGADVLGVVSFHGGLSTPLPAKAGELKAKVLACHGAVDPFVKPEEVAAFEKEMADAKADWSLVAYGGAVHSFTNPGADGVTVPGAKYDEKADKRSWAAMKAFFAELFGPPKQANRPEEANPPKQSARAGNEDVLCLSADPDAATKEPTKEPRPPIVSGGRKAYRIVFVLHLTDAKSPPLVATEVSKAVGALKKDKQSFGVVVVTGQGPSSEFAKGTLTAPTPDSQDKVKAFVTNAATTRSDNPLPALSTALSLKPDLVYLLTDGKLGKAVTPDAVAKLNAGGKVKVNTILFDHYAADVEKTLMAVSEPTDGLYRYIRSKDLAE